MNFQNHLLSSILTRRMALAISEILKGNSRKMLRESNTSSWQANGELNTTCLGSAKHFYNIVFSSKEVTWILRYTESIPCHRKSSVLGVFQRMILCVKSVSSSMIYGITWYPKHRKEPNVGWSLSQLFQICSGYSSKCQGYIPQCNSRITLLDHCQGRLSSLLSTSRLSAQVQT